LLLPLLLLPPLLLPPPFACAEPTAASSAPNASQHSESRGGMTGGTLVMTRLQMQFT
jgi:hypothetical protein